MRCRPRSNASHGRPSPPAVKPRLRDRSRGSEGFTGSTRVGHVGSHQFQRPMSAMTAGTTSPRIRSRPAGCRLRRLLAASRRELRREDRSAAGARFSTTLRERSWGGWDNARPVKGVLADEVRSRKRAWLRHGDLRQRQRRASADAARCDRRVSARGEPGRARCREAAVRGLREPRKLSLIESVTWASGLVALTYQPRG
jgi:hypothetical protein